MRKRRHLSLFVALLLAAGAVMPLAVESRGADTSDGQAVVAVSDGARAADRPRGNGFVRAITAPFRALGRLFGGGRKNDAARKRRQRDDSGARRTQAPAESAQKTPTPTAADAGRTTNANRPETPAPAVNVEVNSEADSAVNAGVGNVPASAVASHGAGAVSSAVVSASVAPAPVAPAVAARPREGARVVRPAEGGAAAPAAPKWVPVIEGIAKDPLTQGRALLEHGYTNEAVSELSVASVVGPDLVEANKLLGVALDRLGQHGQAQEAYERALTVAPDDAEVLNNYGYSLFLDGRAQEALKRLRQAERLTPEAPYVLANMAVVQARLGKYGDAFKSFKRAYGEYEARVRVAELLEEAGRTDDALKHYESARALRPDSPALLERLAALYDRKGRTRDAEAARRAIANPPNQQKTATGGGG